MTTATTTQQAIGSTAFYESIYADAAGDTEQIPWAKGHASRALINWLNAIAPSIVRCGSGVAVVGCGLGDDARELINRGYDVLAFDCSESAVRWAKSLDPAHSDCYVQADVFDAPPRWRHRFDLVVEVNTIQSMPPDRRQDAMSAVVNLVGIKGYLLVIARGTEEPVATADGPPWSLTIDELSETASVAGLIPEGEVSSFTDDADPPVPRLRALYRRS